MRKRSVRNIIERAVAPVLSEHPRVVLAVSGGRDSMVMLEAAAAIAPDRIAVVATFDHGTGPAATAAADHVALRTRELGLRVVRGRAGNSFGGEAASRAARWNFLRKVADENTAPVATAHTADDQLETVVMRVLRNAGARGIAGMYAESEVLRPLLCIDRVDVARYAADTGVTWVDDPSNATPDYLRNRVRHDLLPALTRARPELSAELLDLARRAAALRLDLDAFLSRCVRFSMDRNELMIPRDELLVYDEAHLELLWPALAARFGAVLDRRGTRRLSAFTIHGAAGTRMQLSGGYEVVLHRGVLGLRRSRVAAGKSGMVARDALPLGESLVVGEWRIKRHRGEGSQNGWVAELPNDSPLAARPWRPGDRMVPAGTVSPRRVKGLLRDAGIDAERRIGWPVVLAGDEIVWIPGVRRAVAATVRSERPAIVYECEYVGG